MRVNSCQKEVITNLHFKNSQVFITASNRFLFDIIPLTPHQYMMCPVVCIVI